MSLFGWTYISHHEVGDAVEVTFRSGETTRMIRTERLIKTFGHQLTPTSPLSLSSTQVHSITPEVLDLDDEFGSSQAPVWIVGGGKTAMDTAYLLITRAPHREVNLIAGPGTIFARRESFFPTGGRRWWGGTPVNTMARQVANRFDGSNEVAVREWFRTTYGISPVDGATDYLNAYLSEAECEVIRSGLNSSSKAYLADVIDADSGSRIVLRSGRTVAVSPGSWVVNCTGSIFRGTQPYEPFVSAGGRVLSIQMRSSTTGGVPSLAGYYLTHLMFRDVLGTIGLYALDFQELFRHNKAAVMYASMSLSMLNLSLIMDAVPLRVIMKCGLDYDRWYPFPRRVISSVPLMATHRRKRAHHRAALDTIARRYDLVSGPITLDR